MSALQQNTGTLNVPQALAQALALHEQGRIAEAEPLYAAILAVRPDHFDALQMMALVKLAKGQPAEALKLISAAMGSRKPSPQILLNRGNILAALGRNAEALDSFEQAIKQKSKFAEAHNNRGHMLGVLSRTEEAAESFRKAIAIAPAYAEAHYNLGSILRILGRYEDALKSLDRALALNPKHFQAHNNRGAVLEAMQRGEDALAAYERALTLQPGFSDARNNRSRVLCALGRFDDALASFGPDAEGHYQRGRILIDLNRNDEAAAEFARALALKPDYAEARFAACFAELPILYAEESEIARRRAAYEQKLRALAADVAANRLGGNLMEAIPARQPFLLAYQGRNDCELQKIYGGMIHTIVQRHYPPADLPPPPAPGEPIRVGIVSSFFFLHSNWKIPIKGWISQLDRSRFQVFGYHLGARRDAETDAAAAMCQRFVHRVQKVDDWRNEILADRPHVLIYPGLLMDNISLQLAAQKLAPVQCTSWGHPETSGLPTLDYYFSSDLMEPPDADSHYTEKLVRLPNLSIYYEPVAAGAENLTRAQFGLREDAAVFWCGQSVYKYLPQHDHIFAEIAAKTGNCQFVFMKHSGGPPVNALFQSRLERAFAGKGLKAADHCVFLSRLSQSQFVAAMGLCDAFLDSIGWSGCNSAMESLPNDLPIVTTPGTQMRGRHSAAILEMMGLGDLVAKDIASYIDLAARIANDKAARDTFRARIAANKHRLYRDRACVTAIEDLLERSLRG